MIGPLKLVVENTLCTVCIREKIRNNYTNSTSMTKMPKNFEIVISELLTQAVVGRWDPPRYLLTSPSPHNQWNRREKGRCRSEETHGSKDKENTH